MMNYNDAKRYVRSFSTVRYVEERPFVIAIVELSADGGRPMVAKGLSTCSPTDRWDSGRGQDVARGRAEAKLARRVMRQMAQRDITIQATCVMATCVTPTAIDGIVYQV